MKCPHCTVEIHPNPQSFQMTYNGRIFGWSYEIIPCPACKEWIIYVDPPEQPKFLINPRGANRGPVPTEVPENIAEDYVEACDVLPISAKASAALSRRCLQNILRKNGYQAKDLAKEIDLLLNDPDPSRAIPITLRATIDGIRNFGNFSAHPVTDITSLQIIDVEPHEAEWCLEILEEMFQHFYVRPAEAGRRKAALDAKLGKAGKPASKG
jgi:hypothetical protein